MVSREMLYFSQIESYEPCCSMILGYFGTLHV